MIFHTVYSALCNSIWGAHSKAAKQIIRVVNYADSCDSKIVQAAGLILRGCGLFCLDSYNALKICALIPFGSRKSFSYYGVNPEKISAEQANYEPTLYIHGGFHNQGVWIPLLKYLQEKENKSPIYTLNISKVGWNPSDLELIEQKLKMIRSQYVLHQKNNVKIHLVGYCKGASLSSVLQSKNMLTGSHKLGNMILLGGPWEVESDDPNHYEIVGDLDFVTSNKSQLPSSRQCSVPTTHLGLPFSSEVHETIRLWTQPAYTSSI